MAAPAMERRTIDADPVLAGWGKPPAEWQFDQLKETYNFPHDQSDRVSMFCSFIRNEAERIAERNGGDVRGLDIGCGVGIGMRPAATMAVARCFSEVWGVEPDAALQLPPAFARVVNKEFEEAELPDNAFHVAYSYMVMEHVVDPMRFMTRLYRALAPGGSYLFLTVNGTHYFSRIANALRVSKLDESALHMLFGRKNVHGYHYPTKYRFNRPSQIEPVCEAAGFEKPEYVYVERTRRLTYMKGPLKLLDDYFQRSRFKRHDPTRLLDVYCRVRKPL